MSVSKIGDKKENIVKTKILSNGNKLVILRVANGGEYFEYAPRYRDIREVIRQLKEIYGDEEVNQELNLEQSNKEKVDCQDENEQEYRKEIREEIRERIKAVKEEVLKRKKK